MKPSRLTPTQPRSTTSINYSSYKTNSGAVKGKTNTSSTSFSQLECTPENKDRQQQRQQKLNLQSEIVASSELEKTTSTHKEQKN